MPCRATQTFTAIIEASSRRALPASTQAWMAVTRRPKTRSPGLSPGLSGLSARLALNRTW
jgi:hypothetical protein